MEEIPVIPTLSKANISSKLSYPVGAERISSALMSTPQFSQLKLHFYHWSDIHLRSGLYEFLRVEYLNHSAQMEGWSTYSLYQRAPQYRWEIVVQPVPRVVRHRVKQYILETALPSLEKWLNARAQLAQRGNELLAFFYNEKQDEFETREFTRLEPVRVNSE